MSSQVRVSRRRVFSVVRVSYNVVSSLARVSIPMRVKFGCYPGFYS